MRPQFKYLSVILLVLAMIAAACGSSDGGSATEAAAPTVGTEPESPVEDDPTPAPDTEDAASAAMNDAAFEVASPDGSATLSVPAGAVAADVDITIAVESTTDGVTIELGPDGTEFAEPAELAFVVAEPGVGSAVVWSSVLESADGSVTDIELQGRSAGDEYELVAAIEHFSRLVVTEGSVEVTLVSPTGPVNVGDEFQVAVDVEGVESGLGSAATPNGLQLVASAAQTPVAQPDEVSVVDGPGVMGVYQCSSAGTYVIQIGGLPGPNYWRATVEVECVDGPPSPPFDTSNVQVIENHPGGSVEDVDFSPGFSVIAVLGFEITVPVWLTVVQDSNCSGTFDSGDRIPFPPVFLDVGDTSANVPIDAFGCYAPIVINNDPSSVQFPFGLPDGSIGPDGGSVNLGGDLDGYLLIGEGPVDGSYLPGDGFVEVLGTDGPAAPWSPR